MGTYLIMTEGLLSLLHYLGIAKTLRLKLRIPEINNLRAHLSSYKVIRLFRLLL